MAVYSKRVSPVAITWRVLRARDGETVLNYRNHC
jgi:hypothetical protein